MLYCYSSKEDRAARKGGGTWGLSILGAPCWPYTTRKKPDWSHDMYHGTILHSMTVWRVCQGSTRGVSRRLEVAPPCLIPGIPASIPPLPRAKDQVLLDDQPWSLLPHKQHCNQPNLTLCSECDITLDIPCAYYTPFSILHKIPPFLQHHHLR